MVLVCECVDGLAPITIFDERARSALPRSGPIPTQRVIGKNTLRRSRVGFLFLFTFWFWLGYV